MQSMRRTLTRLVIALIVANAALAIVALLSGDIGDTEAKILGTSLLATACAVLAMMCAPALADHRLGAVPHLGIAGAIVGFGLVTAALWTEDIGAVWLGRTAATAFVVAVAAALACLLSAWKVRGAGAWVGGAANLLIVVTAGMILAAVWTDIAGSGYWRMFSVAAVLLAAAALAVPVLHRGAPEPAGDPITRCPFCGNAIEGTAGAAIACPSCGRRYRVRMEA